MPSSASDAEFVATPYDLKDVKPSVEDILYVNQCDRKRPFSLNREIAIIDKSHNLYFMYNSWHWHNNAEGDRFICMLCLDGDVTYWQKLTGERLINNIPTFAFIFKHLAEYGNPHPSQETIDVMKKIAKLEADQMSKNEYYYRKDPLPSIVEL